MSRLNDAGVSATMARRFVVMFWLMIAGAGLTAAYAVVNVLVGEPIFLIQNLLLVAGFATAGVLIWLGRPIAALDAGFVPSVIVYMTFQAISLWTTGRAPSAFLYIPLLFVLTVQLCAVIGVRRRHIFIPTAASLAVASVGMLRFAPIIAAHPGPASGLAVVFILSTGLSLVTYRETHRADREVELRADLVREVHHRVKNETVMLLALLDSEIDAARSDETRQALARDRRRMVAVLSTHRHLLTADDRHAVPLDGYLADVIRPITVDLVVPDRRPMVHYSPCMRQVSSADAVTIGLMVNELLANAVKHSNAASAITITVAALEPSGIDLHVHNALPSDNAPSAGSVTPVPGFGLGFVQRLVASLDGSFTTDDTDGFSVRVRLPAIESQPAPMRTDA
jgi:two-component sensor histidine kinase